LYILKDINDIYSYAAEIKSVSEDASKPKRTLSIRIIKEQPSQSNNHIVVNIPQVRKPVPLFIVFRALGIISDKEIIQTCLLDIDKHENLIDLFIPSVHDAGNIFTQHSAIAYISSLTKGKTRYHTLQILMNYFLPHIGELNFKTKAFYLGYIVKRLLDVYTGQEKPTDRDSYEFKRISVTGKLIHDLFSEYYKLQLDNIYLKIDKEFLYRKNKTAYQGLDFRNLFLNNKDLFFKDKIVETGFRKAFKGNWGATAHTKKPGVAQE
jgi:DNA-directed RNA polymerase II subunit RPB2